MIQKIKKCSEGGTDGAIHVFKRKQFNDIVWYIEVQLKYLEVTLKPHICIMYHDSMIQGVVGVYNALKPL